MKPLYHRFDAAHEAEPIPGRHLNSALAETVMEWFDDRLTADDAWWEIRHAMPEGTPDEVVFTVIAAVCRVVRQP